MWYHDHALGITRLNVIMGLAAFYVLNPDCSVTPNDPDCNGSLPSGAYDVPFVIQDRDFETDINDEFTGDFDYPEDLQQVFHGQNIVVNGKVWPYLQVDQGKYRFRVLNGSTTRTYTISFVNITDPARPSLPITVIGTEGGFYDAPRPAPNDELTLGPAERFEFIVDFAGANRRDEIIIKNSAVINFPSGTAPAGGAQNIMKLEVSGRSGFTGPVPSTLRTFTPLDPTGIPSRVFNLVKIGDEWLVQSLDAQGNVIGEHWDDITEYPMLGDTEIWEFKNTFGLMHPMHVHLVLFQVLNRQAIDDNGVPFGPIFPPEPLELNAWKDTVKSLPDTVTRVIMRFDDYLGKFPYHCHIIEHEDHEMMRQFQVTNDPANCDGDGICEPNEDCISCPTDCAQVSGASCGNGLCEIGDGENSSNCAQDCAPGCGIGGVGCSDSACTPAGFFCRQSARVLACCGDALCEGQETPVNCSNDCPVICTQTEPVEVSCFDGDDNDCDDTFDCADTDCDRAVGPQTTCGIGECAATGNRECSGGTEIDTCTPGKPRDEGPFGDMTCSDGLDNDCDGLTDNPVDPDCDPVDCSQYTERRPCNREPTNTCVWDRTNNVCVLK
jgi:FtsP/CotA-like multicopper oxidase with cupredoxin domain